MFLSVSFRLFAGGFCISMTRIFELIKDVSWRSSVCFCWYETKVQLALREAEVTPVTRDFQNKKSLAPV